MSNEVLTFCLAKKKVLVQSNSHKSIFIGLMKAGAELFLITP
jgi:arginine/lysine/ornithine decarboxylase